MSKGSEKSGIVPYAVAAAADTVLEYLDNDENHPAYASLLELINAPHAEAVINPDVWVTWEYKGGYGQFETQACIKLHVYLAAYAKDAGFTFCGVLGKHSEVDVNATDFDMCIARGDEEEPDYDCAYKWVDGSSDKNKDSALELVLGLGPLTPDSNIDVEDLTRQLRAKKHKE